MPVPWPTTRVYEQRGGPERNGSTRSASVGPAPSAYKLNGDVESQTSFARRANAVVTGTAIPDPRTSVEMDLSSGPDIADTGGRDAVETQMSVFTFLKIVTAFSALYMCTNPWFFFYKADKGEICPTTVLCATTPVELILLTGSRVSAGVLFASLTISIFSKCYATRSYLHHSWLGAVLDFEPTHDVHTYFGYLTLVAALEHAILHCARFIYAKQAYLIYETDTGRSGMVGCLLLLPIVLPMKFEFIRTKLSFQFRKGLHLMFLPLIVALCFHSVVFRFVGSILILWYLADRVYFTTKQTFLITHPVFEAVGRGTMVVLDLPEGYTFKAGSYIYVNSPTISRSEWHPFSIIQVPGKVSRAAFYAEAVGDWTRELFHLGLEQPRLPLWITAAQPSLMEKSIYYDNVVLVCTGAGITPAVSIIERFSKKKNIHLLLMSRDGGIVGLFEKQLRQVNSTVHVTGTQTEETKAALKRLLRPSTVNGARATKNESSRSIATNDFFTPRPASSMIWEEADDGAGDETKDDHSDPDKPNERPRTQLAFSDDVSLSTESLRHDVTNTEQSQRPRRLSTLTVEPSRPVALVFGRPDIGAYLTDTFAMQMETSRSTDEGTLDQSIDRSKRLDSGQQVSKEELMKADVNVVEDCQQKQTSSRVNTTNNRENANPGSSPRPRPSSPLPWLVLYCGANPKVEEAIAHTCDELHVNWMKEYFGAW